MQSAIKISFLLILLTVSACASMGSKEQGHKILDNKLKVAEQLYNDGNIDAAESMFLELENEIPNNAQLLYRLGTISFKKGNPSKAAGYFESVVKLDPRNSKAHFNLATIRLMQAEDHFKYYIATVDPKTEIDRLSKLIGAIDEYASPDQKKP